MAKKGRKVARRRKPAPVPPLGPPQNLRPAGVHKDRRRRSRAEVKAELQKTDLVGPEPSAPDDESGSARSED